MVVNRARRARLSVEVEPELRRRIKVVAAQKDVTVRELVENLLRRALEAEENAEAGSERSAWSKLSTRSFARDWESDGDGAYDRLA